LGEFSSTGDNRFGTARTDLSLTGKAFTLSCLLQRIKKFQPQFSITSKEKVRYIDAGETRLKER
jgi:hypothetical protein